jgi:hypothetical protein
MPVNHREISTAVIAMITGLTKRACGYMAIPAVSQQPNGILLPYHVLYELGQTASGPPFGDDTADARILYQVTTVGQTAADAMTYADGVRRAFLTRTQTGGWKYPLALPAGHALLHRELDREDGMTVVSSNYSYVQRFAITVTTTG